MQYLKGLLRFKDFGTNAINLFIDQFDFAISGVLNK